ncbi:MAG: hypothetical protein HKN29_14280 [Rhodothermales bacterium]|nr:hypothetical protein [Rhodothermales bacterium]
MALVLFLLLQAAAIDSLGVDPAEASPEALDLLRIQPTWSLSTDDRGRTTVRARLDLSRFSASITRASGRGTPPVLNGFIRLKGPRATSVTIGNFRPAFGAGLVAGSARFGGPVTSGVGRLVRRPRLSGYAGTSGVSRHLGLAVHREGEHSWFGLWREPGSTGGSGEIRIGALTLGAVALTNLAGNARASIWGRMQLPGLLAEIAATRSAVVSGVTLRSGRRGPAVRVFTRMLAGLGPIASPLRSASSHGAHEQGLTLNATGTIGPARLHAGVDHARLGSRVEVRHFIRASFPDSDVRIEHRLRQELMANPSEREWRAQARFSTSSNPSLTTHGALAVSGRTAGSSLRLQLHARWRGAAIDLSLTDYDVPQGSPAMAIYESSAFDVFPIVRLSGSGRRYSARLVWDQSRHTMKLSCHRDTRRPRGPRETSTSRLGCGLSIQGKPRD